MARARNIKPGFFLNDELAECDPLARLLFAGLWCIADREGRLEDRPKRIKAEVLPYDDCDVDQLLEQLAKHGFIIRYEVDGNQYIQVTNFSKHQNPHVKEAASIIPPPPTQETAPEKHHTSTMQEPEQNNSFPADSLKLIPSSSESLKLESGADDASENEAIGIKAIEFAEKAWGRPIAPLDCENITQWCHDFSLRGSPEPDEIVIEALRRSSEQGVRKMSYVSSILKDWLDSGVFRVSQIQELDEQFEKAKSRDRPRKKKIDPGKYDGVYL
ncbi:MAG TPA: DnaD domain protein [Peptococcaceae bacterium]|nr:DnaD domain protein [Peptococcaceae bacterium]